MALKYWFNGLPVTSQSAGQPIGSLDYWFAGLPLPVLIPAALDLDVNISGVSATADAGVIVAFSGTIQRMDGVSAVGNTGSFATPITCLITGVQASAQVRHATTWNPSDKSADIVLSNNNFTATDNGTADYSLVRGTESRSSGKFYVEYTAGGDYNDLSVGVGFATDAAIISTLASNAVGGVLCFVSLGGGVWSNGGASRFQVGSLSAGVVVCMAFDLNTKQIWIRKNNGNWNNDALADPATGVGGLTTTAFLASAAYPAWVSSANDTTTNITANFSGNFVYAAPDGFSPWDDVNIDAAVAVMPAGVTANSAAGTISIPVPGLDVIPDGVSATGEAGTFEFTGNVGLTGVTATCASGDFISTVAPSLASVVATGNIGTVLGEQSQFVDLDGNEATTSVGDLSISIAGARNGASGTGRAGTVHTFIERVFSGVHGSAILGTLVGTPGGQMQQVEGIGGVGEFAIDIAFGVVITGVVGHAGTGHAGIGDGIDGNLCYGESGLMRAKPGANLYSVPLTGHVGSFSFDATKKIPGAVSIGYIGDMVGGIPQPLIGVEATGYVDPLARDITKTLTGVFATGIAQAFTNVYLTGNFATTAVGAFEKTLAKTLQAVQASAQLGELLVDLVTPSKYYLTDQSNFGSLVLNVVPPAAVHTTGWRVSNKAAGLFGIMKYNNEQNFNVFSGVSQLTQAPTAINGNSWRIYSVLSGVISPGTWTLQAAMRAITNASGQAGRIRLRVYKSANSNGLSPTEITDGDQIGTATGTLSTGSDQFSTVTFTTTDPVVLDNEYLFFEVEWEITAAASSNQADAHFSLGPYSFVVIPVMAVTTDIPGVSTSGSAGLIYIDEQKPFEGVSATGEAGGTSVGRAAAIPGVEAVCDHGVFDFRLVKVINGVRGTGIAGDAHSQIALIGAISLVGANGNGFAGDVGVPLYWPIEGNSATGEVSDVFSAVDANLEGVEAVCGTNDIVPAKNVTVALDSIDGVGAAGDISGAYDIRFDGVSAFTVAGDMSSELRSLLEGIFGTGLAGPVTRSPDVATDMPGISATGDIGNFDIYEDVTVTGVQASAQTSTLPFELVSLLEPVAANAELGLIVPEVDYFWQGTQARGFVARLHPNSAIMDGAGATGRAGHIEIVSRSRGVGGRLLPRLVKTEYGYVLWYDNAPSREP